MCSPRSYDYDDAAAVAAPQLKEEECVMGVSLGLKLNFHSFHNLLFPIRKFHPHSRDSYKLLMCMCILSSGCMHIMGTGQYHLL